MLWNRSTNDEVVINRWASELMSVRSSPSPRQWRRRGAGRGAPDAAGHHDPSAEPMAAQGARRRIRRSLCQARRELATAWPAASVWRNVESTWLATRSSSGAPASAAMPLQGPPCLGRAEPLDRLAEGYGVGHDATPSTRSASSTPSAAVIPSKRRSRPRCLCNPGPDVGDVLARASR